MTLGSLEGFGQHSASTFSRSTRPLALLALVAGVAPTLASSKQPATESSCIEDEFSAEAPRSAIAHSMLQVSKPHRGMTKVHLGTESENHPTNHLSRASALEGSPSPITDAHHHIHSELWSGAQRIIGLSFIQTAESVLASTRVSESSGQDMPIKTVSSQRSVIFDGAQFAFRRGFADAAILGIAICLLAWSLCWMSRPCFLRCGCLAKGRSAKTVELPKPQPAKVLEDLSTLNFKESLLEKTGVSFAVPLIHHIENRQTKVFSFNIARRPAGPPISATVTCNPEGSVWAKVELIAGTAGGAIPAPLYSCRLVNIAPDAESRNMQGAMVSWLSLLLHEKTEAVSANPSSRENSEIRVCLHGVVDDLVTTGFEAGDGCKDNSRRLEVIDGMGAPAGYLEPTPQQGQYVLAAKGETVLDIEALPDSRSMKLSEKGEVVALATRWGFRNPEVPEHTGDEEDYLQIDIRDDANWHDTARLLTCTLAMVIFKPEASPLEACKST